MPINTTMIVDFCMRQKQIIFFSLKFRKLKLTAAVGIVDLFDVDKGYVAPLSNCISSVRVDCIDCVGTVRSCKSLKIQATL